MRVVLSALFVTTMLAIGGCSTTSDNPNYQQVTKYKGSVPYVNGVQVQQAGYQAPTTTQAQYQLQAPAPITYAPQQVNYQTSNQQAFNECIAKEGQRKIIGTAAGGIVGGLVGRKIGGDKKTLGTVAGAAIGGAAGYGIADKTIRCDQVSAPVIAQQPAPAYQATPQIATYEAPIEEQGLQETTQSFGDGGTPGFYAVNGITPPATATTLTQNTQSQFVQVQTLQPQHIQPAPQTAPLALPTEMTTTHSAIPAQNGTTRHTVIPGDTLYSLARTTCSSVAEIQKPQHHR